MPRIRPSLALGLVAAVALPLVTVGTPAAAVPAPTPRGALATTSTSDGPAPGARAALDRARSTRTPRSAAAAEEPPAPAFLYVSDGQGSSRITLGPNGAATGATRDTTRTDVVVAPAGDALAYRPTTGTPKVVVRGIGKNVSTDYPASEEPVVWGPLGDGFLEVVGGEYVAQPTNPSFDPLALDLPDGASDVAETPYGGSAAARVPAAGGGSDLVIVPSPLSGWGRTTTTFDLGLSQYAPGAPTVGQEPGGTVYDDTSLTYLAFLGDVTGSNPVQRRLYVDHQDSDGSPSTLFYGNPVPVIDSGFPCDVAAPAFSPDRRRLAYVRSLDAGCTSFEVRSVAAGSTGRYAATTSSQLLLTVPAGAAAPTVLSWQATNPAALAIRSEGANRYEVAANVAYQYYPDGKSRTVVVAGGKAFADALTGGALGVAKQGSDGYGAGPTLLTPTDALHPWAEEEILRVLAPGGTVYIMGGTASVSSAVQKTISSYGITTKRIVGATRYEVAANVARELDLLRGGKPRAAFVSSGKVFADALVAGSPAALYDAPILLSDGPNLPAATKTYLDSIGADADVFAIGGAGAASVATDPRTEVVSGSTRYEVAGNVAQRFFGYTWISGIADGRNWPDAASGGSFMASVQEPILLTSGTSTLPEPTSRYLLQSRASADYTLAFGGPNSIPSATFSAAIQAAGGQTTTYGPAFQP